MSQRIEEVSDEFWENEVNDYNKELIEDFLSQRQLSPSTIKQYTSSLKIFARWVHDNARNKDITELRPRDARRYQDWLIDSGLSPSGIRFKRSTVSSLCTFIETYYDDEHPYFRNIYTKAIPNVVNTPVKEKQPLTTDEINTLVKKLEEKEEWQKVAYVLYSYSTGCRREETRGLLAEVAEYEKHVDNKGDEKNFYVTHPIRAKGSGIEGNIRRFAFDDKSMKAIRRWIDYRKEQVEEDNCEYVFVSRSGDGYRQLSANTFNLWCDQFSEMLGGRPVHPHLFRSSRATNAVVEDGIDISSVQKLLGHSSTETTELYVVRDDSDDLDDLF